MSKFARESLDTIWCKAITNRQIDQCVPILQFFGWKLLSNYLNGGLGTSTLLFPFYISSSANLRMMAQDLLRKWQALLEISNLDIEIDHAPARDLPGCFVTSVICWHYNNIVRALELSEVTSSSFSLQPVVSKVGLAKFEHSVQKLLPYLSSYWVHGSYGSGDAKPHWSDLDGLAIVSKDTLSSPTKLQKLRVQLIKLRTRLVDTLPYQLHGHFVLAESDFVSYPSAMFPTVLFEDASCILSNGSQILIGEYHNIELARDMLWEHAIASLLKFGDNSLANDTVAKVVFLHRTYLLPCLVSQVFGEPMFKRDAFKCLTSYFLPEEVLVLERASSVWQNWQAPGIAKRLALRSTTIFRFNPLLYQILSLRIGRHIDWLESSKGFNWDIARRDMAKVAESVWQRAAEAESEAA